jgi:endoglucanase
MNLLTPSWRGRVRLGFALAMTAATASAQLLSYATNDAYADDTALRFNYAEALQKTLYFLEAQQNGELSPNNRVAWRGDANLTDGSDINRDLAGGLFDAGDHWTANGTMSFVTMTLAWSAVEKPTGWTNTGQMDELLETLIHVNNYFIKCVINPNVSNPAQNLEVAIGCGGRLGVPSPQVHAIWAGGEMADAIDGYTGQRFTSRPTFRLNASAPGGDIPAGMASAMAASSMVIRAHGSLLASKPGYSGFNPTAYADQLYDLAGKLALFANANKGEPMPNFYTDEQKAPIAAYRSRALRGDGQIVEIEYRTNPISQTFTALTWLARATENATTRQNWVNLAEAVYDGPYQFQGNNDWYMDFGWSDSGKMGAYNMVRLFPTMEKYHAELQLYTVRYLSYGQTPGGLRLREYYNHEWGSLRHSNNAAAIVLYYSDLVENAPAISGNTWWKHGATNIELRDHFRRIGKRAVDYALGANPYGRSYLVGFGNQPFNHPHHRGAFGSWNGNDHFINNNGSYRLTPRHILYGALIAGPDNRDVLPDTSDGSDYMAWLQVPGTSEYDTYYRFPNRPNDPVRKRTYVYTPGDLPRQHVGDAKFNEVAIDYNAGFMASLAWLNANGYSNGSPLPDAQFPPADPRNESLDPWTTDREFLVTATLTEDSSSATQFDGTIWNRSRWPARALTSPVFRYYFTHSGTVTPTLSNGNGGVLGTVQTDANGNRFVEITWPGAILTPVDLNNNRRNFTLRLAASGWSSSDDWSRQNAASGNLRVLPNATVSQSGVLLGGSAPAGGSPTAPAAPSALGVVANSSNQITVTWTDNATNETGFKLERSANGTTGWTQIATPAANATSYVNTGLAASTTYHYRLRATNAVGDSAYTAVVNAATSPVGSSTLLTGTVIGTSGSWGGGSNTVDKVFDGNLGTFFDAPVGDGTWAGLDFGSGNAKILTEVRFAPRSAEFAGRMVGAIIQGSSSADFSSGVVNLHTIASAPAAGVLTSQSISNATAFRYARILLPNAGYGNVAELEFYGTGTAPADVTNGLAARLAFDETSGTTAADSTGNGKTGTLQSGASFAAGKINNGVNVNGSGGQVNLPSVFNPATQTDFTATAWVRLATAIADTQVILQQMDGSGTGRTWLYRKSTGELASYLGNAETTSSATLATNTWYHVALVKTGSSLQLYVNGSASGSPATRTIESTVGTMRIGAHKVTTTQYWNGLIDEVRVYNRALSGAELATVYAWTAPTLQSQSITFGTLATKTYGDAAFSLGGTASSGLAVSYSSTNPAVATVSGNTVTLQGAGTTSITATQAGNGSYSAAEPVARTLTVNAAPTLATSSAALTGAAVGTATGNSSVLPGGVWEVTGNGAGVSGTADNVWFESKSVTGDFQVVARVLSLSGGSSPRAGVMVRSSSAAGSIAAFATVGSDARFHTGVRTATNGSVTGYDPVSPAATLPATWVLVERVGDILRTAISTDDTNWTQLSETTVSSLPSSLQVGLFVGSGSTGVTAKATFEAGSFEIVPISSVPSGRVGAWNFGENTGTTTADANGGGLTASAAQDSAFPSWVASGQSGSALGFNGTTQAVGVPNNALLNVSSGMTLTLWVKPTTWDAGSWVGRTVAQRGRWGWNRVWALEKVNASEFSFWIRALNGGSGGAVTVSTLPALNQWTHVAATYSSSTGVVALYYNGVLQGSATFATGTAIGSSSDELRIGTGEGSGSYNGQLDGVRLFNRALSATELLALP